MNKQHLSFNRTSQRKGFLDKSFWLFCHSLFTFVYAFLFFFPDYYKTSFIQQIRIVVIAIGLLYNLYMFFTKSLTFRKEVYSFAGPMILLFIVFFSYLLIASYANKTNYADFSKIEGILINLFFLVSVSISLKIKTKQTVVALFLAFLILVSWDLITIILFPNGLYSVEYSYLDVNTNHWLFGNKNNHTEIFLLLMIFAYWNTMVSDYRIKDLLCFVSLALCLFASLLLKSSTTIVSIAIAFVFYIFSIFYSRKNSNKRRLPYLLGTVVLVCIILSHLMVLTGLSNSLSFFTSLFEKDITFSGRTRIWARAIPLIGERILFGYGYIDNAESYALLNSINSHSTLIGCLIYGGILLTIIFYSSLLCVFLGIGKNEKKIQLFAYGVLCAFIFKTLLEQICTFGTSWFVLVFVFELSNQKSRFRRNRV